MSDEEPTPSPPIMSEYQGKPVLRIPTVENPNPGQDFWDLMDVFE